MNSDTEQVESDDDEEVFQPPPTLREIRHALEILRRGVQYHGEFSGKYQF